MRISARCGRGSLTSPEATRTSVRPARLLFLGGSGLIFGLVDLVLELVEGGDLLDYICNKDRETIYNDLTSEIPERAINPPHPQRSPCRAPSAIPKNLGQVSSWPNSDLALYSSAILNSHETPYHLSQIELAIAPCDENAASGKHRHA